MITFTDHSYIITVETGSFPADEWECTYKEIISLLQAEEKELSDRRYYVLELLREMLPNRNTAFNIAKE